MSEVLTLTLPMPPNIANARMHWRVKHKERQAYFERCDWLLLAKQMPAPPVVPIPRVWISTTLYLGSQMDDDNALARIKWSADWVKRRGYIVDDKRPHAQFTIPSQVVKRDGNYRVEITLTPVP